MCFSHLRWDFVFQRPQHLMTRCARGRRVFFVEEPTVSDTTTAYMEIRQRGNVIVATPHLPSLDQDSQNRTLRDLVDGLFVDHDIADCVLWYYTPMALAFTDHLTAAAIVYDCMDELAAFKGAAPDLKAREAALMRRASLVLTGGQSLYEAKRAEHHNIHPFPSSVDVHHFAQARRIVADPLDQAAIPRPRFGFFGVIDERMDLALLRSIADARSHWQFIMIGPVVKIDAASLPAGHNIHYFGARTYDQLPSYIAGWDVALLPFARNEATQFISPTKTPEYLAAGKPIVSTSIRDVVRPYGHAQLARIADEPRAFIAACEAALAEDSAARITRGDAFLRQMSWDGTWNRIQHLLDSVSAEPNATGDSVAAAM